MNREYERPSRVSLSGSGSSARLLRADELTPAQRRSKDAQSADTDRQYIDMLCDRYRDRGVAGKVHADEARQKRQEALNRAVTPGSCVATGQLGGRRNRTSGEDDMAEYRSGRSEGRRFMTADDFSRYYRDRRNFRNPSIRRPLCRRFATILPSWRQNIPAWRASRQKKPAGLLTQTSSPHPFAS